LRRYVTLSVLTILILALGGCMFTRFQSSTSKPAGLMGDVIELPAPIHKSDTSVEQTLLQRRSVREYAQQPLTLAEVSQMLWAAQGVTDPEGKRTAPSAGALYPLEVYLLAGEVEGLSQGIYRYLPDEHSLIITVQADRRSALSQAALDQESVAQAPAVIVLSGVYERTTVKYGERGIRYVHMEVGSAAQNVYLQSAAMGLGTVFIGAFHDEEVKQVLSLSAEERPLCIMPVGRLR
jgi:SagB-type dehydrogenase family enzyme